tara:strand:- start:113 stop:226 length:114 start_codon:yes stop_codon:yes gene_type:complete
LKYWKPKEKLIPYRIKGKLKNKTYPFMLASKDELPFD